jgi:hypothetical protein
MIERIAKLLADPEQLWKTDRARAIRIIREFRNPSVAMIRARGVRAEFADAYLAMIEAALRDSDGSPQGEDGTASSETTARAEGIAERTPQ